MLVRERTIQQHRLVLSPFACDDERLTGRVKAMEPCPLRTEFQRDRDRIVHCKAFRRMKHKTQCFLSPEDDHFRTRLTHTMEVQQIARTIARALQLNEDLTEAIALGHDLGHTPFGHMGERILERLTGSFAHEEQSLRVVEMLENDGKGLNLTEAVRDGIVQHTSRGKPLTCEGEVVSLSDRIAYINHDIDDACRAGILTLDDIPADLLRVLGRGHSERINTMVTSVITASENSPVITMTDEVGEATARLREFLFDRVYRNPVAKGEESKAKELLSRLFDYFCQNPERMPELYVRSLEEEGVGRCVCDYLAGMTDRYAIELYRALYIPRVWGGK